jgi:hypothetical protein
MTAPKTDWVEGEYYTPAAANVVGQAIVDLQNGAAAATAAATNAAVSKATPVDGDVLPLADSAASFGLKKLSWANLKLAIGLYYNSLTATLTNKTLTSPTLTNPEISGNILDDNGAIVLQPLPQAGANTWARLTNGVTPGGGVTLDVHTTASSTATFKVNARGNGGVALGNTAGVTAFEATTVTSGVNYVQASASATGADPFLAAAGADANLHLDLRGKGTGLVEANGVPVATTADIEYLRANDNLSGGGLISVSASFEVLWAARMLVISNGRSAAGALAGFWQIDCPPAGTVITGVGGAVSTTATAAGIPMAIYDALYYILPLGAINTSVAANFRLVNYTGNIVVPSNWVLIAFRSDGGSFFFNRFALSAGQSLDAGKFQSDLTVGNTLVRRDASGGFSAGAIAANALTVGGVAAVTTTGVQSLSNKTLASPTLTGSVQLNGIDVATTSGSQGLSNKTISGASNTLANIPQSAVTSLTTDLAARQTTAQKGVANGYASLDGTGKLPTDQLPALVSVLSYRGTWNASTNSPTLANGTGTAGHTYRVDTAGTALGSTFAVGDYVIYTGSVWQKSLSTDDATRNAVERTAVATLTNKTLTAPVLTSPTITGTPVADFAVTRQVAGQGKFLPGTVVDPSPTGQGAGSISLGLHNDLAHLIERGGTGTITQNGNSVDASGLSALFKGSGLNISAAAVTDVFVIEIVKPATHPYAAFWQVYQTGINFRAGYTARSVKIEHRVSGVWTTSYDVTGDTEGVHYVKGTAAPPYVDAFRFTLTDFMGAGTNLCRIQNIWSIGTTANPAFSSAATNFLPRSGGDLFGTTAAPPALQAAGGDANIDLDLRSKGTGVVEANGVPVVTTTNAVTLTNKTLTNPQINFIRSTSDGNAILIGSPAGAVNYVGAYGNTAGSPVYLSAGGTDANIPIYLSAKGTSAVNIGNTGGSSTVQVIGAASTANTLQIFGAAAGSPPAIAAVGSDTNVSLSLASKGTGTVNANGIPVVTTTGAQTVTNKTISGASNTVTNLPASATPDAARLVCSTAGAGVDTENGANTWAKIASWPGLSLNTDLTIVLGVAANNSGDYAIVSASQRNSGAAVVFNLQMLALHAHPSAPQIGADSFKLVSDGQGSTTSLWVQKKSYYGTLYVYELSRANGYNYTVSYHAAAPWQSAEPVGTLSNARTAGVTVAGVPVVTTTGTATLTNKTLTSPRVNQINDTNGATALILNPVASAVNHVQISNSAAGQNTQILATGSDTNVNLRLSTKGNGAVAITTAAGTNAAVFFPNANSVNYPVFNPSITGAAPNITAGGSDTNIDLNLISKGAGSVQANGVPVATTTGPHLKALFASGDNSIPSGNMQIAALLERPTFVSTEQFRSGTQSFKTVGHTWSPFPAAAHDRPLVNEGETVYGDVWVYAPTGQATTVQNVSLRLDFFNAAGTLLSNTYIAVPATTALNGVWTKIAGSAIAPAGSVSYGVTLISLNLGTNEYPTHVYYWDDLRAKIIGGRVAVPATATSTGVVGQWSADASWHYVCTATNTWRRAALSTW